MTLTELLYKLERENAPKEVIDKVKRDIEKMDNYLQLYGRQHRDLKLQQRH